MDLHLYQLIQNYQAPAHAHELVAAHPPLCLAGPTGAGKNTLATYLAQTQHFAPVVSDTTRAPRVYDQGAEVNGVHYWFLTEDEAAVKLQEGAYIEAKAVHRKSMYGTSIASYEQVVQAGKTPILEIDIQGLEEIMDRFSGFDAIFLLPPDFATWLQRLDGRGEMPHDEKVERLRSALVEINSMLDNPRMYPVVNTEVVDTAALMASNYYKYEDYQTEANVIARELVEHIESYLIEREGDIWESEH